MYKYGKRNCMYTADHSVDNLYDILLSCFTKNYMCVTYVWNHVLCILLSRPILQHGYS